MEINLGKFSNENVLSVYELIREVYSEHKYKALYYESLTENGTPGSHLDDPCLCNTEAQYHWKLADEAFGLLEEIKKELEKRGIHPVSRLHWRILKRRKKKKERRK